MNRTEHGGKTDPVTGLWTGEWAGRKIEYYLNGGEADDRAVLCLMELSVAETVVDPVKRQSVLRHFAFLLRRSLRKSDIAARIGEKHFLVFYPGCRNQKEADSRLEFFRKSLDQADLKEACGFAAGIAPCVGERSSSRLVERAKGSLYRARMEGKDYYAPAEERFGGEETGWVIPAPGAYLISRKDADMDFVGDMMDYFQSEGKFPVEIEPGLQRLCRYFKAGEAYIVEDSPGEGGYTLSYSWKSNIERLENDNLKRIPEIVGRRYSSQFDSRGMIVCSHIEAMEELDPVMAERQKLRGTRSMMQSAIFEAGEYIGYIGIADKERERLWTEREIMTCSMVCKVIACYLLQLRAKRSLEIIKDYDLLTTAWNYNRFLAQGGELLSNDKVLRAVVTVDIKNFKMINAQYGYEKGNEVLIDISSLLNHFTAEGECYARIEADKFVLLLEYQLLGGLQQRLKQLIRRVEQIPEQKLGTAVTCTVGVCLVEHGDSDMSILVDHANMARKSLKDYHKSVYSFYNKEAEQKLIKERELSARMKGAVENEEFVVYYQPKISLNSREIFGLEALVRWKMGDGGLVPPDEFIPLFEKNGFITELDLYVFERVCRLMRSWKDQGRRALPIGVNISRIHIKEPDFLTKLTDIRQKYGILPEDLELEITESAFLHNQDIVMEVARQIKEAGFVLSMDDFGTGYSSLSLLKDLPVDIIKLDKEFFQKKLNEREKIIIANVIRMAKQLNIQVISEGIETLESEQFLREIGCDLAQGYLYGRPQPIEDLDPLLYGSGRGR